MLSRVPLTGRSLFMHLKRACHERGRNSNPFAPLHEREGEIENSRGESTTLFSGAREGAFPPPRPSRFRTFRLKNDRSIHRVLVDVVVSRVEKGQRRRRRKREKEEDSANSSQKKGTDRSCPELTRRSPNGLTRPLVPAKINSSAASIHYRGLKLEIARNTTGVSVTSRRRFELNRCQSPAGARPAVFPERRRVSKFKIT